MMKRGILCFASLALVWVSFATHTAAASKNLEGMYRDAFTCSDAVLQDDASHTCDPPQTIAAKAVVKCQAKWDALADAALGSQANASLPEQHARSRASYSQAMEYEYVQLAELKAIDIRTAAGRCGFE